MSPPHKKTVDNYLIKKISIKNIRYKKHHENKNIKNALRVNFRSRHVSRQDTFFNVFLGGTDFAPNGTNDMSDPSNYYTFSKDGKESTSLWGGK